MILAVDVLFVYDKSFQRGFILAVLVDFGFQLFDIVFDRCVVLFLYVDKIYDIAVLIHPAIR